MATAASHPNQGWTLLPSETLAVGAGVEGFLDSSEAIDVLWPGGEEHNVLLNFVQRSQTWSSERIRLPARLRRRLWIMVVVQLAWATWLTLITTDVTACGTICMAATLDHPVVMLLLASTCLIGLLGLAPLTRGLARANGQEVLCLGVAMAAGAVALLGVAALAVAVLVAALVLLAFLTAFTFDT